MFSPLRRLSSPAMIRRAPCSGSELRQKIPYVDCQIGVVGVDAKFLADGAAGVEVAGPVHIFPHLLAFQPYGIQAHVVYLIGGEAMIFKILDEIRM